MKTELNALYEAVRDSKNTVFLGGAGVSTESGIPDFRSADSMASMQKKYGHSVEEMLSLSFFLKHPEKFYAYYRANLVFRNAQPNAAHIALAQLEQQGRLQTIVTQNIDGLHQLAGSKSVVELHGSAHRNYCVKCNETYTLDAMMQTPETVPHCTKCGGTVRPDVTLYEERMNEEVLEEAVDAVSKADVLIIGGTSLVVYPAAGLIECFRGSVIALLNKDETPYDSRANIVIRDSIGAVLKELAENV